MIQSVRPHLERARSALTSELCGVYLYIVVVFGTFLGFCYACMWGDEIGSRTKYSTATMFFVLVCIPIASGFSQISSLVEKLFCVGVIVLTSQFYFLKTSRYIDFIPRKDIETYLILVLCLVVLRLGTIKILQINYDDQEDVEEEEGEDEIDFFEIDFDEPLVQTKARRVVFVVAEDRCIICLEDLNNAKEGVLLSCSHLFHKDCIQKWLDRNPTCPTCRERQ